MGNQQGNKKQQYRNNFRKNTIDPNEEKINIFKNDRQTINASLDVSQYRNIPKSRNLQSLSKSIDHQDNQPERDPEKSKENDRTLEKLSRKNQELRKELKKISDQLTQSLKKKKFVPKKKVTEAQELKPANAGIKRELENAYKQVNMYKNTLQNLRLKEQNEQVTQIRMQRIENEIINMDIQIATLLKKNEGLKNVKATQDNAIVHEMNDEMHYNIQVYKKELQAHKNSLKQYLKRDRERQGNYKKQQAYLCQVQQKWRIVNGEYAPTGIKAKSNYKPPTVVVTKEKVIDSGLPTEQQFERVLEEVKMLRQKHEDYHRKIDSLLQLKNKASEGQTDFQQLIEQKQTIIASLQLKVAELKKLLKPTKKSVFGAQQSYGGPDSELLSELDHQSQVQEHKQPDLFDIKHLIANIPKPIRQRPKQITVTNLQSQKIKNEKKKRGGQMVVTVDKSEPKKWNSVLSRFEERGKTFKGQLNFNDSDQFQEGSRPLIVGLSVWVNVKNEILGIQAIYLNNEDIRYGYKSSTVSQGTILHYDLQRPDYIKNITGSIGAEGYIENLVLSSKNGKIGRFGNVTDDSESFNFGLSSGERPFIITGSSTLFDSIPRLNKFGMEICSDQ